MIRIFVTAILFYFSLISIVSCNSKQGEKENDNIKNNNDSLYIKDSLLREEKMLACDTSYDLVDIILIEDGTNEDEYSIAYYSQTDNKKNDFPKDKSVNSLTNIFLSYAESTNRISEAGLHYLAKYIDKNCECRMPVGYHETQTYGIYVFKLIRGKHAKTCYVSLREIDAALEYFKGLKVWLKDSKYKHEFEKLIRYIDYSIGYMKQVKG